MAKLSTLKAKNYFFWDMYAFLNSVHFRKGSVFTSKRNGKKYTLSYPKRSEIYKILTTIAWMLPAVILVYLVITLRMYYINAIFLIIVFHFTSMWYLIRHGKMWKK